MTPTDARDLIFAGAGILWGIITVYRGIQEWLQRRTMLKHLSLFLIGMFIGASAGWCEDAQPSESVRALQALQVTLDHAARRANQPSAGGTPVIALRGAKQESAAKTLYWKGREDTPGVLPQEVKALRDAVALAQAGRNDDAAAGLKAFLAQYPSSPLKPEAEAALGWVSAAPAAR